MKIAVLGLGVIGTTYAYALQKAGHETFHIVREGKRLGLELLLKRLLKVHPKKTFAE